MKAVLFDFDGVLVDSIGHHLEGWKYAVQQLLGQPLSEEKAEGLKGKSTQQIAEFLCPHNQHQQNELIKLKQYYLIKHQYEVKLFDGVVTTINKLKNKGIPLAVASNAPAHYVRSTIQAHKLPIDVVLGIEDVRSPKPAPDLYLLAAKKLGISPADHPQVWVLEDSTHGIKAGCLAGMYTVGITTHHPAKILFAAGAQASFPSVERAFIKE